MEHHAVSIVLCTYNRLPYLKICLPSLIRMQYPDFEIIVVNDGSTDGTKEYLDGIQDAKILAIHHERNRGLSEARNTGIRSATHQYVAFTDDDCLPDSSWLSQLMTGFSDDTVGFVIGQTFYISRNYQGYFPERLVQNKGAYWPMGCNIAYRKNVFEKIGYFDPEYFSRYNNEDTEMAIRAVAHGYTYTRMTDAIVFHQAINWTPRSLLRSAKNASVWPALKKRYPTHYLHFQPKEVSNYIVYAHDYAYFLLSPIILPILLIRYLYHGKRDLKIFFCKWPVWLILRRYYIYREAIRQKVFMI